MTSRRLLYLCLQHNRPGQASGVHVSQIAAGLARRGWGVTIVEPRYAAGAGDPGTAERLYRCAVAIASATRQLARRATRPSVLYVRAHVLAAPVVVAARALRVPVVQELNGPVEEIGVVRPWLRPVGRALAWAWTRQLAASQAIVCVTDALGAWASGLGRRVAVIPNGADVELFRPGLPRPAGVDLPDRYAVFFGAFAPWQGLESLAAARRLAAWPAGAELVLAGDGVGRPMVEALASDVPGTRLLGVVDQHVLAGVVSNAVVGVSVQSATPRNLTGVNPLKVFETMASGVPVVVSDLPGQADLVRQVDAGEVVPPDDPAAVAHAVARFVADPELRAATGRRARAAATERLSWDTRAGATHALLVELLDEGPERR